MKNIRFFCNLFFVECFVCRDLTINLNFITWTPLAGLTWVCTAPSSGRHVQEHKGATRSPSGSFLGFYFLCCASFKTGSQGKTTVFCFIKNCSFSQGRDSHFATSNLVQWSKNPPLEIYLHGIQARRIYGPTNWFLLFFLKLFSEYKKWGKEWCMQPWRG